VFSILEMLVGEPEGVRITDVANELDLNRAIPHGNMPPFGPRMFRKRAPEPATLSSATRKTTPFR
jgi:hypothetical protein